MVGDTSEDRQAGRTPLLDAAVRSGQFMVNESDGQQFYHYRTLKVGQISASKKAKVGQHTRVIDRHDAESIFAELTELKWDFKASPKEVLALETDAAIPKDAQAKMETSLKASSKLGSSVMDTVNILRSAAKQFGERGSTKLKELLDMHRELMAAKIEVDSIATYRDDMTARHSAHDVSVCIYL